MADSPLERCSPIRAEWNGGRQRQSHRSGWPRGLGRGLAMSLLGPQTLKARVVGEALSRFLE